MDMKKSGDNPLAMYFSDFHKYKTLFYTNIFKEKLEMCQYDTDVPAQGHNHPHAGILQKMKLKKGL